MSGSNFHYVIISEDDVILVKSSEVKIKDQIVTMSRYMDMIKREPMRKWVKNVSKLELNDNLRANTFNTEKFEELENSVLCFLLPYENKYCFVDMSKSMELFSIESSIKFYDFEKWMKVRYNYTKNDFDFFNKFYESEDMSKYLESITKGEIYVFMKNLVSTYESFDQELLESCLEKVCLF